MKTQALKGMRDLLPAEQTLRDYIQGKILETYRSAGFERISTPMLEDMENLDKSDGGDNLNLIFKVLKRGDKLTAALNTGDPKQLSDMGLRYDLTLPLSRYYAANKDKLPSPFKVIQTDRVFRAERPQKGRLREFVQCDIDILGDSSPNAEVELIDVTTRALLRIGFKDFTVNINDRRILRAMLEKMGFAADQLDSVCISFDKLDKIGPEKVKTILVEDFAVSEADADEILKFIAIKGSNEEVLTALEGYTGRNGMFDQGLSELNTVVKYLADFGVPAENFAVDLTIARGLDYYTGTVYETTLLDHPEIGSVCSGGRYDNLAEFYTDKQLPGVGISIGLTRLFYVLDEQGLLNPELPSAPADALVLPMGDIAPAIALAETLRSSGLRVQLYCEQKKFKQKMAYADKLKVPFAVLLGEDEIAEGKCSVKNMKTGEQLKLTPAEAAEHIKASLDAETGTLILEK